jgi:hypothetical protein
VVILLLFVLMALQLFGRGFPKGLAAPVLLGLDPKGLAGSADVVVLVLLLWLEGPKRVGRVVADRGVRVSVSVCVAR